MKTVGNKVFQEYSLDNCHVFLYISDQKINIKSHVTTYQPKKFCQTLPKSILYACAHKLGF